VDKVLQALQVIQAVAVAAVLAALVILAVPTDQLILVAEAEVLLHIIAVILLVEQAVLELFIFLYQLQTIQAQLQEAQTLQQTVHLLFLDGLQVQGVIQHESFC
jgi:hypothetical protein